jgi:hypothetical protein
MLYFVKEKKFGIAEKGHYRVIASDRRERSNLKKGIASALRASQ